MRYILTLDMSYKTEKFGTLKDGSEVQRITLSNEKASVSILTLGAIIQDFSIKTRSGWRNIVCSSQTLDGYIDDRTYKGQVVAPNCNRIANASFECYGKRYHLDVNNGRNNLHSGSANTGSKLWSIVSHSDKRVVLNIEHVDGEGGFPGNILIKLAYILEGTTLRLEYSIAADRMAVVNPTNHAYFNLHGAKESILDHKVKLNADRYIKVDDSLIPEAVLPVKGTDYDFTTEHEIGERIGGRYDNCFVFPPGEKGYAEVSADGLKLTVKTDRPGMQIYAGEFFSVPDSPWGELGPFDGVALETSGYPDSVNHRNYPSVLIEKWDEFRSYTEYKVEEV